MKETLGQLLDEYLSGQIGKYKEVSSVYLYMEHYDTPKAVICTTEQSYDYTEVLYSVIDLRGQEATLQKNVKSLQDKIRQLEKSKKDVEKALALLAKVQNTAEEA